jgi:two-component system cell cycle response regulator
MSKATILLVQDARTQGNSTKRYLETAGHTVIWAGSGMSALLAAGKYAVDLILLDVSLPDIDGSDLCHRFRSRRDTHMIPIILFTAHEMAIGGSGRKSDGPDAYLVKPFTQAQLSTRITEVLHARPQADAARPLQHAVPQSPTGQVPPASEAKGGRGAAQQQVGPAAPQQAPGAGKPSVPPARPDTRPEPTRTMVAGPRSALKPKPEPEPASLPAAVPAPPVPPAKPVLRLVPKPQLAAAQAPASAPPVPPMPSVPPFGGSLDQVVDPATGLFGRTQFEVMFSKEFKRAVRFKQQMSCMIIDLDGSDMGRKADETLVKALIAIVQRTIREVDTAAWWTGGSLIVLLPNTMRNDAVQAGMRILEAVAVEHFTWPDSTQVTVNIGVAGLPDRKIDSEQKLIEAAAVACVRAHQTMLPPPDPFGRKEDR